MTGRTIGHYRMIDKLGEGGMGKVYRAVDVMVDREVALKSLRAELAARPEVVERFRSEAATLARLNHPNVAQLYSFFKDGSEYFMVMEFVAGNTLEQAIQAHGPMPWPQALEIGAQVLDGIQHAHQLGILHRDIKPANIILPDTRKSTGGFQPLAKITDFGIAQALGSARVTREGHLIGTLEYMAPERIQGKGAGPQSDLYSMAIVLYEMLTGNLPFQANSEYSILLAQVQQPPPRLRTWRADIPFGVEAALLRALEKDPARRYPDAASFATALRAQVSSPLSQASGHGITSSEFVANLLEIPASMRSFLAGNAAGMVIASCVGLLSVVLVATALVIGVTRLTRSNTVADEPQPSTAESHTPPNNTAHVEPVPSLSYEPGMPIPIGQILGEPASPIDADSTNPAGAERQPQPVPANVPAVNEPARRPPVPTQTPSATAPPERTNQQPGAVPDRATVLQALDITDGPTAGGPGEWPIHRAGLERALQIAGGQWILDIAEAVELRGVNFLLTPSLEGKLKASGADARLLKAVAGGLRSIPRPGVIPAKSVTPEKPPSPKPVAVSNLRDVRHLYIDKMPGNMDSMLRQELQRALKGKVAIAASPASADARMSAIEEEAKGGLFAGAGRAMGLKDRYQLRVRVVSVISPKELWTLETGDRNPITATHGSRAMQKAVAKVASEFLRALQ